MDCDVKINRRHFFKVLGATILSLTNSRAMILKSSTDHVQLLEASLGEVAAERSPTATSTSFIAKHESATHSRRKCPDWDGLYCRGTCAPGNEGLCPHRLNIRNRGLNLLERLMAQSTWTDEELWALRTHVGQDPRAWGGDWLRNARHTLSRGYEKSRTRNRLRWNLSPGQGMAPWGY